MSIQPQWSVNETSGQIVSAIGRVIAAAASDNVQAFAILACEQFGNTLAICDETLRKVETEVLPSPPPIAIQFLKAAVGYSTSDCATQLGGSEAGLRFLGLAAALINSTNLFHGAKAINIMLRSTASDLRLLPTVQQLRDLLASLEARSQRCGFAENVTGWHIFLLETVVPHLYGDNNRQGLNEGRPEDWQNSLLRTAPSPEMVTQLVDTFRQLARIGDSTIVGATIKVTTAAPWVIAFTKWCLGLPPSVYTEDKRQFLGQSLSPVTIVILMPRANMENGLEVSIHNSIDNLNHLVAPGSTEWYYGMVRIEKYGEWLLQELGFRGELVRVLYEALEYGIPQILKILRYPDIDLLPRSTSVGQSQRHTVATTSDHSLHMLPSAHDIVAMYSRLLNPSRPPQFSFLSDHELISDLPLIKRQLESLAQTCQCAQCHRITDTPAGSERAICRKASFFGSISFIIADILVLSLISSPAPLLVRASLHRESGVEAEISRYLRHGGKDLRTGTLSLSYSDILAWARDMVGHKVDVDDEDGNTLLTAGKGQVLYPVIFETFKIERKGYIELTCLPGNLKYEGETYRVVMGGDGVWGADDLVNPSIGSTEVRAPLNLFPDINVYWKLRAQDGGVLHVSLAARSRRGRHSMVELNPMDFLWHIRQTLFLERCPHDGRNELSAADRFCSYASPFDDHTEPCESSSHVKVVAVDRADDVRFFALTRTQVPLVLRGDACLSCCLDLCREADVHVLVV